jgi:L-2-hydroxyglutarate oxidase
MVRQIQRLLPEVRAEHLVPAPAGVRAQAVRPDGSLVDDFLFVDQPGSGGPGSPGSVVHVLNAPSPAATAALPIGREILARLNGGRA